MQVVASGWTAEERDSVRKIVQNTQISWHKQNTLGSRTFTIGVSLIGGNDVIGANPGAIGSPGNYKYFNESAYITSLSWERGLSMPTGGLTKALAEATLDNTSGRFTPRYMGGSSELYTAQPYRSPVIINAGFNFGIDQMIPQFAGIINKQPGISVRNREMNISIADYIDYFQNKYLDQEVMFTSETTDQVMSTLLQGTLGMNTSQFNLDPGINVIPFGLFEKGTRFSDIMNDLAEAENGQFYQDELGIFRFENRQHWDSAPYTNVQRIILTGQVIDAQAPNEDHLINVVEIRSTIREKQPLQTIYSLPLLSSIELPPGDTEQFFEFQDPVLALTNPTNGGANSFFKANSNDDETGTDYTSSVSVTNLGTFAKAVKYRFRNNSSRTLYITQFVLAGRVAKQISDLYYRAQDDSSVTAYQERVLSIENDYIQNASWAASYSQMILNDFSEIENLQRIIIRAIPELQLGDLVSWQGRYWRIFDIKTTLEPSVGYIQELIMLQRTITSYFRIGISTIGGTDKIAP